MYARAALLAVALCGGCVIVAEDATLTIHNHSSHTLREVRLAHIYDWGWGPNEIVSPLPPGADLLLTHIDCDRYDVLVGDGIHTCVLDNVHLCYDDHAWAVTDASCGW